MFKVGSSVSRRLGTSTCSLRKFTSAPVQNIAVDDKSNASTAKFSDSSLKTKTKLKSSSNLVAAVFASLKEEDNTESISHHPLKPGKINTKTVDEDITVATDVNSLLNLTNKYNFISRYHALKIVSKLSDWSSANVVQLGEFESDPRFLKICRILSKHRAGIITDGVNRMDDLNVIFSVTGDDEATRLITALTLSQMIKVMCALAQKKRRNTPILRGLSFNIAKQPDTIDLKRCADLLFAMAALSFPDEVLLDRICNDIQENLPKNVDRSSVVGSIAASLGFLKYKDPETLNLLSNWIVEYSSKCRPQDMASVLISHATLGHPVANEEFFEKITVDVKEEELSKPSMWLDVVWALTILDRVTNKQITSVLSSDFLEKLIRENADVPIPTKKKLLLIENYIKLMDTEYTGPFLQKDIAANIPIVYTKEKTLLVETIMDAFKNLIASESFLKQNCNSNMGFLYDGECALDEKCNPVPLNTVSTDNRKIFRIALIALDYHDLCRKTLDPIGAILLYKRLLEKKGFKVLLIPYTEFNSQLKLVNRVQYLERRLKETVLEKPV